ncbi:MAG: DUF4981 domain-containing protein [Pseudarcicella sp.]|nr:DUF4981 domain-containing protein [Pseudarcicella sp.]
MKKKLIGISCCLMLLQSAFAQLPEWRDPAVFRVNTLPQHAFFIPYNNELQAKADSWMTSPNVLNLNGLWKFNYADKPSKRPADFYKKDYDVKSWKQIKVPSDWQMEGYDVPIFANSKYPWMVGARPKKVSLELPDAWNPVGSYKRTFNIPATWKDKRLVLHFGGVNSAYYVWVNGKKVGYAEDTKMDAEFDITAFAQVGNNDIAVEVYRWCDGSYLEDQDFWRLSGIERDVFVIATPKVYVEDIINKYSYSGNYNNCTLNTTVQLKNDSKTSSDLNVQVKLFDETGKVVAQKSIKASSEKTETLDLPVPNAQLWSAEKPYLYTQITTISKPTGEILQAINQQVGFRFVELKGTQVLINGLAVLFKGVNRHEHHPDNGHVIDEASMIEDIKTMKAYNINAVRNCHYPNAALWYKLCNKYGLYMVDEADVESHGMGLYNFKGYGYAMNNVLARDNAWYACTWDRIHNMYQRDKNNPSIIFWSLGNEAGRGENFQKAYKALKSIDTSRPVQYEQAWLDDYSDIVAPMYHRVADMEKFLAMKDKRPMILCEYAHSMGNSTGNMKEYWDLIENNSYQLQGGFIWDWKNQTFNKKTPDGKPYFAWQPDYDPKFLHPDDGCSDGLVFGDGTPEPSMEEVKKVYQHIKFSPVNMAEGKFSIKNNYYFTNLSDFDFTYKILKNGEVINEGKLLLPASVKPQETIQITVPSTAYKTDGEVFVNVYAALKTEKPLLKKGHVVAYEQLSVSENVILSKQDIPLPPRSENEFQIDTLDGQNVFVTGEDFTVIFDNKTGMLSSYRKDEKYIIRDPLVPNFWRAPVNNDMGAEKYIAKRTSAWKDVAKDMKLLNFKVEKNSANAITVKSEVELAYSKSRVSLVYNIERTGNVKVDFTYKATKDSLPEIPRIGMSTVIREEYDNLQWYGRGPHESYWDRNTSALVGLYKGKVKDQFVQYEVPQENGNKTDVRWFSLTNSNGNGLSFKALDKLLDINAQNYLQSDLENKFHPFEVPLKNLVEVHIDYSQMGVGGDNSWGLLPMEKYLLKGKEYKYSFLISTK